VKIDSIRCDSLHIPFTTSFRHASAERAATQTVWVEAHARGQTGYGEGCPREYVTGETLQSAAAFCARHVDEWCGSIRGLASLRDWSQLHCGEIDRNPAAWCAVELALLDLIGRSDGRSVESVLGAPPLAGRFRYTAVLGDAPPEAFTAQLAHYVKAGFENFKIKLSGDPRRDAAKVKALRDAGIASVRADANNLWQDADSAIRSLEALEFPFQAIEEPLRAGDISGMARLAAALETSIVLDESVVRAGQLDALAQQPERWIVNVRISKMGGVLRSMELVSELRQRGLRLIIGAHVGETSLLTRAALSVANGARDLLIAQEGAFGTHLLARDVVDPALMFGPAGVLEIETECLNGAGWGLCVRAHPADIGPLSTATAR
jgi:L-Ala-D/L-Glu epimerase